MHRTLSLLAFVAVLAAPNLAHAETVFVEPADEVRFRGAIQLGDGFWAMPKTLHATVTDTVRLETQLGVQWNRAIATYLTLGCDGSVGFGCSVGLLFDHTFVRDHLAVAIGPEAGGLLVVNANGDGFDEYSLVGGRVRIAWYPLVARHVSGRRHALTVALDVHALYAGPGQNIDNLPSTSVVSPTLSVGYTAF